MNEMRVYYRSNLVFRRFGFLCTTNNSSFVVNLSRSMAYISHIKHSFSQHFLPIFSTVHFYIPFCIIHIRLTTLYTRVLRQLQQCDSLISWSQSHCHLNEVIHSSTADVFVRGQCYNRNSQ